MIPHSIARLLARATSGLLVVLLAAFALPSAAKTMFYVPEGYDQTGAWYLVLNATEGKARLVGDIGAKTGTYTDNGTPVMIPSRAAG